MLSTLVVILCFFCSFMSSYELPEETHKGKILLFHGMCVEMRSWSDPFQKQEL